MNEKAPYQSPLLNQVLHARLRGMDGMRYDRSDAALKSVALIGMLLPDNEAVRDGQIAPDHICSKDSDMLNRSFNALSKADVPLHPEASFHIYNILPPVQSDFLLAALDIEDIVFPQNDLAIIMYLPKKGIIPNARLYMGEEGFKSLASEELDGDESWRKYLSVSHIHANFHIWAEAAGRLGSKMVITHGGIDSEITTQNFEGHRAFTTLIDSEDNQRKKGQDNRNNMGVVIRTETMKELAGVINPKSEIGDALLCMMG